MSPTANPPIAGFGAVMNRIMALIDLSEMTPAIVKVARDMARAFNGELLLVHVIVPPSELSESESRERDFPTGKDPRVHERQMDILKLTLIKEGINAVAVVVQAKRPGASPLEPILAKVAELAPDLIIMGSHGHGRLHHLAGSATDTMVRRAPCPVLIVPNRKG